MKYSKFTAEIVGANKTFGLASTVQDSGPIVRKPKTHYILLIDRSGSMYSELNGLLDQVIETIDHISSDDLLTIMWYSSPGQFQTVVKGATANTQIKSAIDKLRRTVGSTCFSDPLKASGDLVKEFASQVDQTSLVLFTDGQPCVYWSAEEEQKRSETAVSNMTGLGLSAMTCIGYGNYYNRDFLLSIADKTDHGQIMHNSRIDEFLETFKGAVGAASDLIKQPIDLVLGKNHDVVYLTDKQTQAHFNVNTLHWDSISANHNDFYMISDADCQLSILEGASLDFGANRDSITKATSAAQKISFFYGYASKLYYYGKRKEALDIIVNNCKDKFIANMMVAAFTNDEVAAVQKVMDAAVFDTSARYQDGKCEANFLPKKDALCVLDIFNTLFDKDGSVYYIPLSKNVEKYVRIGKEVKDSQDAFKASNDEVRMPLSDLSWNSTKLNLNIPFNVKGTVTLNAKAAKAANLPVEYPAIIIRTHTIVKDGALNIPKAEFVMDGDTYRKVVRLAGSRIKEIPDATSNMVRAVIDFTSLPIINQTYIDDTQDLNVIYDLVKENVVLEAKNKVLGNINNMILNTKPELKAQNEFAALNADQVRVLSEHGVSDKGIYGGIDRKVVEKEEKDSYETRILDFGIKGYKTLPTNEVFTKSITVDAAKAKTSGPLLMMQKYYKELADKFDLHTIDENLRNQIKDEKADVKSALEANRRKIAEVKLAKILNNDFFTDLQKDDKGNTFFEKDLVMTVKSERKLVHI